MRRPHWKHPSIRLRLTLTYSVVLVATCAALLALNYAWALVNADRQIAFGYGVHFCLGAQLARMELRSLFGALVPRLQTLELCREPTTAKATFVGGHKTVPIRYTLTPA